MDHIIYTKTSVLKSELKKSFSELKHCSENKAETVQDNFLLLKSTYVSVKNAMHHIKYLPADSNGKIRLLSYIEDYFKFSNHKVEISNLLNHFVLLSENVCFTGDEISVLPEILKMFLLILLKKKLTLMR